MPDGRGPSPKPGMAEGIGVEVRFSSRVGIKVAVEKLKARPVDVGETIGELEISTGVGTKYALRELCQM